MSGELNSEEIDDIFRLSMDGDWTEYGKEIYETQTKDKEKSTAISPSYPITQRQFIELNELQSSLPSAIAQLISNCANDLSFIFAIMTHMTVAEKIYYPFDAFKILKLGLLLSLVADTENPIHVMVIGEDTSVIQNVMRMFSKYANRLVDFGQVETNRKGWINGGSMVLARGGIFEIDNFMRLKPKDRSIILTSIEKKNIPLDKSEAIPLESSVWSYFGLFKPLEEMEPKTKGLLKSFVDIYGVLLTCENSDNEALIDILLHEDENVFSEADPMYIGYSDLKEFIRQAKAIRNVNFNQEAEHILKNYIRKTRRDCLGSFSNQSMLELWKLAKSSAKLCLRDTVISIDAAVAINIFEEFLNYTCKDRPPYKLPPLFDHTLTPEYLKAYFTNLKNFIEPEF